MHELDVLNMDTKLLDNRYKRFRKFGMQNDPKEKDPAEKDTIQGSVE